MTSPLRMRGRAHVAGAPSSRRRRPLLQVSGSSSSATP